MKILQLRLQNLNSLYGEWSFDFTAPEYQENGIFAITGPTGAGKSTILDGICLALYGRTPRLDRVNKSINEIMSRRTGQCFAEVVFSSVQGTFCCHFSQHRARKKADGRLVDTKHEISDALSGTLLASKKRDVAGLIEKYTGMDFDRFTRSVLLAQGDFASFLQAPPDKRAPVLEQITGTKIYSDISRHVHERYRHEQQELERLKQHILAIELLSKEKEKELARTAKEIIKKEKKCSFEEQRIGRCIEWQTTISATRDELARWEKEAESIQKELTIFAPEHKRLERAGKAALLDEPFGVLLTLRSLQEQECARLAEEKKNYPELEVALIKDEEAYQQAKIAVARAIEAGKNETVVWKQVRQLDVQLAERNRQAKQVVKTCKKAEQQLKTQQGNYASTKIKLDVAQEKYAGVKKYLTDHAADEQLVTVFEALSAQLESVQEQKKEQQTQDKDIRRLRNGLKQAANLYEQRNQEAKCQHLEHKESCRQTTIAREKLAAHLKGKLLQEYRNELDHLQEKRVLLQRIATLEQDRKRLEDGKPCPLCGALEHPYARGNVPEFDAIEQEIQQLSSFVKEAHALEEEIAAREKKEKRTAQRKAEASTALALAQKAREQASQDRDRAENERAAFDARLQKAQRAALDNLLPFGIRELPDADLALLRNSLQKRLNTWLAQTQKKEAITKTVQSLVAALEVEKNRMENASTALAEKNRERATIQQAIDCLVKERKNLYGNKDPDKEEARLEKQIAQDQQVQQQALTSRNRQQQRLVEANTRISALKESTKARTRHLAEQNSAFLARCTEAGFLDEKDLVQARLTEDEKEQLEEQAKSLAKKEQQAATRIRDCKDKLAKLAALNETTSSLEELQVERNTIQAVLKKLREKSGAIMQQLDNNRAAREKVAKQQEKIKARRREFSRWERLHGLIGSADGKKYRNFAQGITFELMVAHANSQLAKMTDRYLLVRDVNAPLELNVIDNYQAGEVRSTKNLSGGESFIVSLALALGLSKMAGRKIQVDSLFLDEGFGTLDEEALQTSLETLANLHQQGKIIGVISHIPALQERISTQIHITPVTGGKSIVSGPGCSSA